MRKKRKEEGESEQKMRLPNPIYFNPPSKRPVTQGKSGVAHTLGSMYRGTHSNSLDTSDAKGRES